MVPKEVLDQIHMLMRVRDDIRQELSHRSLTGRHFNHPGMLTSVLETDEKWYVNKIESLLAPYEKGN